MKQQSLFPQAEASSASLGLDGWRYRPEFITESEEQALATALSELPLKPFEFHGYLGNRRVLSFGLRYDYSRRGIESAAPPPAILDDLRARIAGFAVRPPEDFRQIGINEYRPGAGIGWHKDKPEFGDVVGISLLCSVRMRFRKRDGDKWTRASYNARTSVRLHPDRRSAREVGTQYRPSHVSEIFAHVPNARFRSIETLSRELSDQFSSRELRASYDRSANQSWEDMPRTAAMILDLSIRAAV